MTDIEYQLLKKLVLLYLKNYQTSHFYCTADIYQAVCNAFDECKPISLK